MIDPLGMNRKMDQQPPHFRSVLSDDEFICLQELAFEGNVLEIGSWTGYSAYRMAFSANRVDCVDPFIDSGGPRPEEFLRNTNMYDSIYLHIGKSADIVPIFQPIFDLAFIDGDHSFASCRLDLELAFDKVKFGGVIALHDYNLPQQWIDERPAIEVKIREAVDDFLRLHCRFKMVRKPRMFGDPETDENSEDRYEYRPPDIHIVDTIAWFRVNWRE